MPRGRNAPKDWPPPPLASTVTVSSGREAPQRRVISEPRMVPKVLSTLDTAISTVLGLPVRSVSSKAGSSTRRSAVFSRAKS